MLDMIYKCKTFKTVASLQEWTS